MDEHRNERQVVVATLEQRNWVNAYQYVLGNAPKRELNETTILTIHKILMEGIEFGGVYRQVPVCIPDASHDFPLPGELPFTMKQYFEKLELYHAVCGMPEGVHPVMLAAWSQAEFVTIHPFRDGNGRVARFYWSGGSNGIL